MRVFHNNNCNTTHRDSSHACSLMVSDSASSNARPSAGLFKRWLPTTLHIAGALFVAGCDAEIYNRQQTGHGAVFTLRVDYGGPPAPPQGPSVDYHIQGGQVLVDAVS